MKSKNTKIEDALLIKQYLAGDETAFNKLYKNNSRDLRGMLSSFVPNKDDLDDLSQEVWLKIYGALPSFRGDSSFFVWAYRISINTTKTYLVRNSKRRDNHSEEEGDEYDQEGTEYPENLLQARQMTEDVLEKLNNSTLQDQAIYLLNYDGELADQQIATILEVPLSTVKSTLHRVKKRLAARVRE